MGCTSSTTATLRRTVLRRLIGAEIPPMTLGGRQPSSTARPAWWCATRTTDASSCGVSETRLARDEMPTRWLLGLSTATRAAWFTMRAIECAASPTSRLGVRLGLPSSLEGAEWFGLGPSKAYADTASAVRVGKYAMSIDALQTPCIYPQENENRMDVRWASFAGRNGGLKVESASLFNFAARRWSPGELHASQHTYDLVPGDNVWLNSTRSCTESGRPAADRVCWRNTGSTLSRPSLRPLHRNSVGGCTIE